MTDPIGTNAITKISRRYLMPNYFFGPHLTEEERHLLRRRRAAEWEENTAAGFVAITSDYDTGEYTRSERFGPIDRWVAGSSWDNYLQALAALKIAEADLS
jgi:hypothetical protein